MTDFLFEYINRIRPISDEVKEFILEHLEIMELAKSHVLLKEGQRCDYVYVVLKGLLRLYYLKDNEEVCSRFAEERQLLVAVNSFFSRVPGYEFIETLEPCVIARFHHDRLQQLYTQFEEYNYIGRVVTQQYFIRSEERLYLLRKQSAEERYSYITEHYPSILLRTPLKYIASYLGITVETLSRIRKKLSEKNARTCA